MAAAMGGLDACYGRWDTHNHPLADVHPTEFYKSLFPGQGLVALSRTHIVHHTQLLMVTEVVDQFPWDQTQSALTEARQTYPPNGLGGACKQCSHAVPPRRAWYALMRVAALFPEWRLDRLLKRKAEQGVRIYVMVYKEVAASMALSSKHTKHALENRAAGRRS
jgi:hypothetical protein